MPEWLLPALTSGAASGLIFYGAIRVELRWLRRDVDHAHWRIDGLTGDRRGRQRYQPSDAENNDQ